MRQKRQSGMSSWFQKRTWVVAAAVLTLGVVAIPKITNAQFQDPQQNIGVRPQLLKDVGVDQKLNEMIPLDLVFRDESGSPVELGQYFGKKPVILSLVYFSCPMLCTQVLNGLERSLQDLTMSVGKQFNVITVSIDPSDRPVLAAAKQAVYTGMYGRPGAAAGWHFLTGDQPQITRLARAVGFRYAYDAESRQFAHASVIMVLTPEGKISRYFYGITFPERDLRLGLVEASEGKIGSPVDAILLFCYHYDPHTGKYGLLISRLIQVASAVTVIVLGILIFVLFWTERYALPAKNP